MIYPIIPYGDPVLRKVAQPIEFGSMDLVKLSADMFETMYDAPGIGLAAPQVDSRLRLAVIDLAPNLPGAQERLKTLRTKAQGEES